MKNKSKYLYKNENNNININENTMNTFSDSTNNCSVRGSKKLNYSNLRSGKNGSESYSSNGLSFLIYSSNKETNKYKKDALFGNLFSLSKEKAKMQFK